MECFMGSVVIMTKGKVSSTKREMKMHIKIFKHKKKENK